MQMFCFTVRSILPCFSVMGLKKEDRVCGHCCLTEVENVEHFVLRCDGLVREREVR